MSTEEKIVNFIKSYFSPKELEVIKQAPINNGDNDTNDEAAYLKASSTYFNLFKLDPNKWNIQTDESASALIDKLLNTYCTNGTMLCKTRENYGKIIYDLMDNNKGVYIYTFHGAYNEQDHLQRSYNTWIQDIIDNFYKSESKKLFLLIPRMIPGFGYILKQEFFVLLKRALEIHNIEYTFILDDCQASFYLDQPIDYELFDGFLVSSHLFFPGLSGAILFMKNKNGKQIAHKDLKFLEEFAPKLEILYANKDKAHQFNDLLSEYFSDLDCNSMKACNSDLFPKHQFIIHCNDIKPVSKYCKTLFGDYMIRMFEPDVDKRWMRIRFDEALIQNPNNFVKGLKLCKKYLKAMDYQSSISLVHNYEESLETMYEDDIFFTKHSNLFNSYYINKDNSNEIMFNRIRSTLNQYKSQLIFQERVK